MQTVSGTFAPYADTRWSDLRVQFRLVDVDAAGDATPSAIGTDVDVSQLAQTHDGTESMGKKWATLETGGWPLDGSCVILPDSVSGEQTGWWSELSDENGDFDTPPALTFDFASAHSSVGFTVIFDDKANRYPTEMAVSTYDASGVLIDSKTAAVTSARQAVEMPVEDYRKVVISFGSAQAGYQRVRVAEVIFGIVQLFERDNLTSGTLLYELSPAANNLPAGELTITIDNSDQKYNLLNPSGLYIYLQQGQPMDTQLGVGGSRAGIEYVNMGRFYFAKSEAEDSAMTARITAYDRFWQLDRSVCRIGTTGTWTVSAAVAAVIANSGLSIATVIPAAVGARIINKCVPSSVSHREALRLIAQAARCTCWFNRDDELVFAELAAGTQVDALDRDNMTNPPKVTVSDRINTVELTVRDEYAETETVYTAADLEAGETAQVWAVENPLGDQATADWLLAMAQMRIAYEISERGNPARELMDTVTVEDAYSVNADAVIIKEQYDYDGALAGSAKGVK